MGGVGKSRVHGGALLNQEVAVTLRAVNWCLVQVPVMIDNCQPTPQFAGTAIFGFVIEAGRSSGNPAPLDRTPCFQTAEMCPRPDPSRPTPQRYMNS